MFHSQQSIRVFQRRCKLQLGKGRERRSLGPSKVAVIALAQRGASILRALFRLARSVRFVSSAQRCFAKTLSSLLSFPANPLAQQLLGQIGLTRQAETEKQEEAKV